MVEAAEVTEMFWNWMSIYQRARDWEM